MAFILESLFCLQDILMSISVAQSERRWEFLRIASRAPIRLPCFAVLLRVLPDASSPKWIFQATEFFSEQIQLYPTPLTPPAEQLLGNIRDSDPLGLACLVQEIKFQTKNFIPPQRNAEHSFCPSHFTFFFPQNHTGQFLSIKSSQNYYNCCKMNKHFTCRPLTASPRATKQPPPPGHPAHHPNQRQTQATGDKCI